MCFVFPLNGRWSVYSRISSAAVCFTSFTVNGPFSNTLWEDVPRAVTHKQYFACITELGLGDIIENVKNADFFFLFPVLTWEINTSEQIGIKCICRKIIVVNHVVAVCSILRSCNACMLKLLSVETSQ